MILARALGTCIKLIWQSSNTVLEGTHWIIETCSFSFIIVIKQKVKKYLPYAMTYNIFPTTMRVGVGY